MMLASPYVGEKEKKPKKIQTIKNIYIYIYPQDAWFAVASDASILFSGGGGGGGGFGGGLGGGGCDNVLSRAFF